MDLAALEQRAREELAGCTDEASLRAWHTKYFGRQGEVPQAMSRLKEVPPAEKPAYGREVNRIKDALTAAHEAALARVREQALERSLTQDALDVRLPGRPVPRGRLHVATLVMREIRAIFADMGFQVYRSREVEDDRTNFELLNMPPHHPARDMWDTFHATTPGVLLRTHTSPGQIHVMRELCPEPIRVILPGMCYRYEAITARSEIQFEQVEGLCVGTGVTMADLKGTITAFARRLFGPDRQVRLRSSYFPFTEPSIEVDIDCNGVRVAARLTRKSVETLGLGAGMPVYAILKAVTMDRTTLAKSPLSANLRGADLGVRSQDEISSATRGAAKT